MKFIDKLPYFYEECPIVNTIQEGLQTETDNLYRKIADTVDQFYIENSTWGLDLWEKMLDIPKNKFDIQTKRENIKAKIRSRGTTTLFSIKYICEAYSYGEVDIIVDHANYSFVIDFVGSKGIPKAFAELDKTIEEIKPAHLAHSYKFNYNTHGELVRYTHGELANYTHDEIRNSIEIRGESYV